jgi:hypothetical protein
MKTSVAILAATATLLSTSIAADASWRCPSLYGAYYPTVVRCYDWQFDPNGPTEQATADAQKQAIAVRAEQERQAAMARQAADLARLEAQREAMRAHLLDVAQEKAENSPDNHCRDPKIAGMLLKEFNGMDWPLPRQALDIEHLVTISSQPLSCHGVWILTRAERIEGTMSFKENVAGEIITTFHHGTWQPPLSLVPDKPSPPASMTLPDVNATATAAFRDGAADRQAWETWFNALSSDEHEGAFYWASQRSLSHPGNCAALGGMHTIGCQEAKARLSPSDARRKSEPDYKAGWNSINSL